MEDIDAKDQRRSTGTKCARRNPVQIGDRDTKRGQCRPREKHDFILAIYQPFTVILIILLLLAELFHQLAFTIAMHRRKSFILTVFGIVRHMRIIIGNNKEVTKTLRKKGCEKESDN